MGMNIFRLVVILAVLSFVMVLVIYGFNQGTCSRVCKARGHTTSMAFSDSCACLDITETFPLSELEDNR